MTGAGSAPHGAREVRKRTAVRETRNWLNAIAFNFWLARAIELNEAAAPLWAFGEPQQSIRLIAICFSLQILFAGGADGYNNSNGSAMSLNKKHLLATLDFTNRFIQCHFPVRAFVAPNVGNPFMGVHSFRPVNALYLHGVRHPNLLTGACYQDCHAFVRYAIALSKNGRLRGAKRRRRRTAPGITGQSVRTYAAMRNRFMFPHAAIHHSRRSRQALFSSKN